MTRELQIQLFKENTGLRMETPGIKSMDDIIGKTTLYMDSPFDRRQRSGVFIHGYDSKKGWRALYGNIRPIVRKTIDRLCDDLTVYSVKVTKTANEWATVSVVADGMELPVFLTMIYFEDYQQWLAKRMS